MINKNPLGLINAKTFRLQARASILTVSASLAACVAPAQAAGIPVTDPVAIAQSAAQHAAQIAKYVEQIATLKNQLDSLRRQYEAFTGTRNLGDLFNNPAIRGSLPDDVQKVLASAEQTFSSISRSAERISKDEQLSGDFTVDSQALKKRFEKIAVNGKAIMEEIQKATGARMEQVASIQAQINLATDPKAISDLQARLLVEQANIQADQMRADALSRQLQIEQELADLQAQKLAAASFSIDAIRAPLPGVR